MNSPVRQPVLAVCVLLTGTLIASALPPLELVSGAGRISRSAGGDSWVPMVSGNGQWIAFQSTAPNLVARDVNGAVSDVMVREGASGVTQLVSVTPGGESGNGESVVAGISRDGRYVLFVSDASDLVAGDDNEASDVFVRDLVAGVTRLVSVTPAGGSGSAASGLATFSPDARFVLFESDADDLVAGDTNGVTDVFQRDLETGITRRISVPSTDPLVAGQPTGPSGSAWQSADGRTVVFQSEARNLAPPLEVAGQRRLTNHLYYLRPPALTNRMVNAFQATTNLVRPGVVIENLGHAMSADGRYLVTRVQSSVPSEVPDGLFHLDLDTGVTARLNQDIAGAFDVGSSDLTSPQITADGQTVFFEIMELDPVSGRPALPVV
ncbi:MAG: hypothetical protein IT580_06580, partial [Verrucomicrobiales bacterium]|nr:hypothetical protein [Verrucomicrobiales bacterium]